MKNDKLIVLGTGNAMVTNCYNTCFAIKHHKEYLLVDAGGGNGIFNQLNNASINMKNIHHLIVTHGHTDHVLGVIWVVRKISQMINNNQYQGQLKIYCHQALADMIKTICEMTLTQKLMANFDNRIYFDCINDGDQRHILDATVTFFDIHSTKMKQYGFTVVRDHAYKLTCLGDEPYNSKCEPYVINSDYLLSEAFCLYKERKRFKPYEKHHSTVRDAAQLANSLNIPNLVLWHTEDSDISHRKKRYKKEAKHVYFGKVYVPNDLDCIKLKLK